jgi:hypothetical protein
MKAKGRRAAKSQAMTGAVEAHVASPTSTANDSEGSLTDIVQCGSCETGDDNGWHPRIIAKADYNGICICTVEDLPSWHFQHRRIKNGYRYCASYKSAILSMSYWHNESINVWSHILAPIGILLYFGSQWSAVTAASAAGNPWDKWLLASFIVLGNVIPLLCSAACHGFYCVDKVHCFFVVKCSLRVFSNPW